MFTLCYSSTVVLISLGETLWTQSVQFEVFTMNNMFVAIVLFLTIRFYYAYWQEDSEHRSFPSPPPT